MHRVGATAVVEFQPTIGEWWIAGEPASAVPGFISLGDEDKPWRLTTDGGLARDLGPGFDLGRTVHGLTPSGEMTLLGVSLDSWQGKGDAPQMQVWSAFQLITGGHVLDTDAFTELRFSVPHLLNWIGPTELNYHTPERFRVTPEDLGTPLRATPDEHLEVTLGATVTETVGQLGESWEAQATYTLTGQHGVTLRQLERVELALASLHSILADQPMQTYGVTMGRSTDLQAPRLAIVDPGQPDGAGWGQRGHRDLFFDTSEIEFSSFIRAWLNLWDTALMAVAMATPKNNGQTVQSRLVDVCNGLEALAVQLWEPPALSDDEELVLAILKDNEVDTRLRRRVKSGLRMSKWPLEDKLIQLAGLLGTESSAWLLGPSTRTWAHLVARLRNSLAHGSTLNGGLSDDHPFVIMTYMSAAAVLRLALLSSAGFTNPSSQTPGELLWARGKRATGHPNSPVFHRLEDVARYAGHWATWSARLEGNT